MKKKVNKRKIFFVFYAIFIACALIFIMFIADDSFFLNNKNLIDSSSTIENKETFKDYEEQIIDLKNNVYSYKYEINYNGVEFYCTGTKNKTIESGVCTKPNETSYTEKNYEEAFADLNTKNLDIEYIFEIIGDTEAKELKFNDKRNFTYEVILDKLKTEITITTNYENITQICIANGFETYILTYSNIEN